MASAAPILVLLVALAATGSNADSSLFRLPRQTKDKQGLGFDSIPLCTFEDMSQVCHTSIPNMDLQKPPTTEYLQLLCSSWDAAKVCVKDYLTECWGKVSAGLTFDSQNNMAGYLCGDGRKAALEESACWSNQAVQTQVAQCKKTAFDSTLELYKSQPTKRPDFCPFYHQLKSCITISVYQTCQSKAAANFMDNMYYAFLAPQAKADGCKTFAPDFEAILAWASGRL